MCILLHPKWSSLTPHWNSSHSFHSSVFHLCSFHRLIWSIFGCQGRRLWRMLVECCCIDWFGSVGLGCLRWGFDRSRWVESRRFFRNGNFILPLDLHQIFYLQYSHQFQYRLFLFLAIRSLSSVSYQRKSNHLRMSWLLLHQLNKHISYWSYKRLHYGSNIPNHLGRWIWTR